MDPLWLSSGIVGGVCLGLLIGVLYYRRNRKRDHFVVDHHVWLRIEKDDDPPPPGP